MSGALQVVFQNQRSFGLAFGAPFGGGFYAGQISTAGNGIADYNLVIGPVASAQNANRQWKSANTAGDPTSVINGPTNSSTMNSATYPAAQFCEAVTTGGFSDWYMPALNELEVCYYNLKPTTRSNSTSSGTNTNAVPSRGSNYTAGTPAQTSAPSFITGNSEAFASNIYWLSTQYSGFNLFGGFQHFDYGRQGGTYKTGGFYVRAVRRVAV